MFLEMNDFKGAAYFYFKGKVYFLVLLLEFFFFFFPPKLLLFKKNVNTPILVFLTSVVCVFNQITNLNEFNWIITLKINGNNKNLL